MNDRVISVMVVAGTVIVSALWIYYFAVLANACG